MRSILIAVVLVAACGTANDDDWRKPAIHDRRSVTVIASQPPLTGIASIDHWTKLFYAEALRVNKRVNRSVAIEFADDEIFEDGQVGLCTSWTDGYNLVQLRSSWWKDEAPCMQGLLVIHELGHCAINRDHESVGIMLPVLPNDCKDEQDAVDALTVLMAPYMNPKGQ